MPPPSLGSPTSGCVIVYLNDTTIAAASTFRTSGCSAPLAKK
jgi:hypothetical protein